MKGHGHQNLGGNAQQAHQSSQPPHRRGHGGPLGQTQRPHDGERQQVKPHHHPHRVVGVAAFHGGQVRHGGGRRRHQSESPHAPGHTRVKALDHDDAHQGAAEEKPLLLLDFLPHEQQGQHHREHRAEVLNDRGAGQRDVPHRVEEPRQAHHAGKSADHKPHPVVAQDGKVVRLEVGQTHGQRQCRSQEDQLKRAQPRQFLHAEVGARVEHHRGQHGRQAAPHRTTVTVPRKNVGTKSWKPFTLTL